MTDSTVISVGEVSKRFVLHKEKSLKERIVNFRNRSFGREEFWALRDVSLSVEAGETVGLVGANGSGKSTLLKTIGGIIQPTTGTVTSRGRIAALLELGAGFHPDLTGRENVYLNAAILGLTRKQTDSYFDAIVDFSGIEPFIDTQVKFYSSGMYVRLAFAVAVHVDPEILLVDEVLAVGDEPFQRKCLDKIRSFQLDGRTIVLVSHSAESIGSICSRGVVLDHGSLIYDGDPAHAIRVLRGSFEDARVEAEAAKPLEGLPTVDAVRLVDRSGRTVRFIRSGEDLAVEIDVASEEPVDSWLVSMAFETPLGMTVFRTSTDDLRMNPAPLHGSMTVRFDLPSAMLANGEYFLHVALGGHHIGTVVNQPRALTFTVDDGTHNTGVLSIAARGAITQERALTG